MGKYVLIRACRGGAELDEGRDDGNDQPGAELPDSEARAITIQKVSSKRIAALQMGEFFYILNKTKSKRGLAESIQAKQHFRTCGALTDVSVHASAYIWKCYAR